MSQTITTISVPMIFGVTVNSYLVKVDGGFILIDTGLAKHQALLDEGLEKAGVDASNLKLIILTHGDPDHVGNGAYLREKYGVKIAIHSEDVGMVEQGKMGWNRKMPFPAPLFFNFVDWYMKFPVFTPDIHLKQGNSLAEYGLDATIIELPGHCKGNIGILTADGNLFCGDLLANNTKPEIWIPADKAASEASVEKLKSLSINMIYPGHGAPFRPSDI